ncbi:MAG: hypothetical protein ACD_28C00411G0003 [uncultured bacterium]|nr:MAG: hypothetical protein ACD_28C00411G0003 [uncultured bacterium]
MIVMKFGGTSMGTGARMRQQVAPLIHQAIEKGLKPVVVVSAMTGVTNQLLALAERAQNQQENGPTQEWLDALIEHHRAAVGEAFDECALQSQTVEEIENEIHKLLPVLQAIHTLEEFSSRSQDMVLALGEKLGALLLSRILESQGVRSENVNLETVVPASISYQSDAYWTEVERCFRERLDRVAPRTVPVLTGFFGSMPQGILNAVGRGYSDFCASLAGAAVGAEEIQIWTDVDGVLSTNPNLVPDAFILEQISFDEMAELSHFGAKVLHPHSVRPALQAGIPIRILNTFNPEAVGTLVTQSKHSTPYPFKSIAYKKGVTLIRIESPQMLMAYGYIGQVGALFAKHKISIDLITTSELTVSLSVDESPDQIQPLLEDLKNLGQVDLQPAQSIISMVGTEMQEECHIHGRIFDTLNEHRIPIHMASIGNKLINLTVVVDDQECDRAVTLLHQEFFSAPQKTTPWRHGSRLLA